MNHRTSILVAAVALLGLAGAAPGQCQIDKLLAAGHCDDDIFGACVAIDGDLAIVGARWDDEAGDESGSAYIYRHDGAAWVQETKLMAPDGAAGDVFGISVDVDGDLAIVGAMSDDDNGANAGSVYVFRHAAGRWALEAKLVASIGNVGQLFGNAVSVLATPGHELALVGAVGDDKNGDAAGAAFVFAFDGASWSEVAELLPADGAAGAHFGDAVSLDGMPGAEVAIIGAGGDDDLGSGAGAAHVFAFTGGGWAEKAKLHAADGAAGDHFGTSAALCIDGGKQVAVVGARHHDVGAPNAGAGYVFRNVAGTWMQEQRLLASDGGANDSFGSVVAIAPDILVVGALLDDAVGIDSGSAYVYRFNGATWVERWRFVPADGAADDLFGSGVAVGRTGGEDVVLAGAPHADAFGVDAGAAYAFHFPGGAWAERQKLGPTDGDDDAYFGDDMAIDGDVAIVGTDRNDWFEFEEGAVHVFRRIDGAWTHEQRLVPSDGALDDRYGRCVTIRGKVAVVGAFHHDTPVGDSGAAYVYRHDGFAWIEEAKLVPSDAAAGMYFGTDVAIVGDPGGEIVLVGAPLAEVGGQHAGAAYLFAHGGGGWTQVHKLVAGDGKFNDQFGERVALLGDVDGMVAVIGAPLSDERGDEAGAAYVFRFDGSSWTEERKLLAPDGAAGDRFGSPLAIDGSLAHVVAVVGASADDDRGDASGAAYVHRGDGGAWTLDQKLLASDGAAGDAFGWSVAIDGTTVLVGAPGSDVAGDRAGATYAFAHDGGAWIEIGRLVPPDLEAECHLGDAAALADGTAFVGAPGDDDDGVDSGSVSVFGGVADCNGNGRLDCIDIADGVSLDLDGDLVPDECDGLCGADLDGSGAVDFGDILAVLGAWDAIGAPEDLDGSGVVDFGDLLLVLGAWGPCP